MQLLILCAPVWFRSSRLSRIRPPPRLSQADVVAEDPAVLGLKRGVRPGVGPGARQGLDRGHQRLGDVAPAEFTEVGE